MTIDRDREAFEAALRAHIAATGDDRAGPGFLAGWQAALTHAREAGAQEPAGYGMRELEDVRAACLARVDAAAQRAELEPAADREAVWKATKKLVSAGESLSLAAQTAGGASGRDEGLCEAIEQWSKARDDLKAVRRIVRLEPAGSSAPVAGTHPAPVSPPTDHSEDALDMVKTPRRERGWG